MRPPANSHFSIAAVCRVKLGRTEPKSDPYPNANSAANNSVNIIKKNIFIEHQLELVGKNYS